jgi:hypothetical protein
MRRADHGPSCAARGQARRDEHGEDEAQERARERERERELEFERILGVPPPRRASSSTSKRLTLAHDVAPEEEPTPRSSTRRLRLADEPPSAAYEPTDSLTPAAYDPEALARRDTRAWQDALVLTAPARRPGAGDPGALMLLLMLSLVLWLERPLPAPAAPSPEAPVATTDGLATAPTAARSAEATGRSEPTDLAGATGLERRRLDPARAGEVLRAAAPRPPVWTEPLGAAAFLALAACTFALLRTQVGAGLALIAAAACVVQVSARPPGPPTSALALATVAFGLVAARGAAWPWRAGVVLALAGVSAVTVPAAGAALLGAWSLEAVIARRWRTALVRSAMALAPLVLAGAGLPPWGAAASEGVGPGGGLLGGPLLLLAVPGAGVLCARGAWAAALTPVALVAACDPVSGQTLMTPFAALAAVAALDAGARALTPWVEPGRRWLEGAAARLRRRAAPAPLG